MASEISKILNKIITQHLLDLHTAFIAKVVKMDYEHATASIQPVSMTKTEGRPAEKRPVQTGVPVLLNALYYVGPSGTMKIKPGDLVYCVCADREITHAVKGDSSLPSANWHHEITDAVVVGVIQA